MKLNCAAAILLATLLLSQGCGGGATAQDDADPILLTKEEIADGWISLFDGKSLYGWRAAADCNWRAEDGAIVVSEGEVGLLQTTTQFADYVLKLEFQTAQGTNSGVFLRTPPRPRDPAVDCYELNIAAADVSPFATGSLVNRQKAKAVEDSRDWHFVEALVDGPRIVVKIDGEQVLDYTDPAPLGKGFIGLQHNSGLVRFRNIKLKPLGTRSLFNGRDLAGWQTYPNKASVFSVTEDGYLHVANGPGQLETSEAFGDFVLQLECITHGEHLNSGVFFRCIPGEDMNGYESQIHNGFLDGDPTKPVDCGTGGIFRRQNARRVVAADNEWFSKTIIADGAHLAVWVNGYQVCDWTDHRRPDPNPRRGLRLSPGTIMLQGHDPTTDISFRNLRIAEVGD